MKKRTAIAAALIFALTAGGAAMAARSGDSGPGWHHGERMGMKMARRGGSHGGADFCHMVHGGHMTRGIDVVEAFVEFSPEQQSAWAGLTEALATAREQLAEHCEHRGSMADKNGERNPMDGMARMEAKLEAQLEALRTVRPAAEAFWNTLTDEQQQALQGLMRHRRGPGQDGPGADDA